MTMQNQLTAEIRRLVPELLKDGCESGLPKEECIKKFHCVYCRNGWIWFPISLEHCRVALRRERERREKESGKFFPSEEEVYAFNEALWGVDTNWEDLQPFEQQLEVHRFLSQYLLNEKDEK